MSKTAGMSTEADRLGGSGLADVESPRRREEAVQQPRVDENDPKQEEIGDVALHDFEIAQHRGHAETDHPGVETHAEASECFGRHRPDESSADRHTDEDARQNLWNER